MHSPTDEIHVEQILRYLQQSRGFDFTAYKQATLMRRLLKRMQTVGVAGFEEYFDFLQLHQEEFAALFNTILINVTSFHRDPEVWSYLSSDILPEIIKNAANADIRVWSAGCASGQEPYTIAMAFAELLGADRFRERVKIYGTDIDEEALAAARAAVYPERALSDLAPDLVDKYFDRTRAGCSFKRDLRRAVIFGRHDLLQDAPISRVDLLVSRNTLMYFNSDAQARILGKFYFALKPAGYVVLGRAEMLLSHGATFSAVDLKRRVFRAVPRPNHRDRLFLLAQTGRDVVTDATTQTRLREVAFDTDLLPQLVVDASGIVVAATTTARQHFRIGADDIGRPIQELEVSYRPAELRAALQNAVRDRRSVQVKDVEWNNGAVKRAFDVDVSPILDTEGTVLGTRISFHDITALKALQAEVDHSKQELETAYEELQSTNEELETTNEELQSTVEELETTNEELQSTNEELETMNEELQSTNEELQTMNDELRGRSTDLNSINAFLESVFTSLRSAVIVVDREFRVQVWNPRAMDLWGLRPEEVHGRYLLSLDIGLPLAQLHQPIRDVLSATKDYYDTVIAATSRKGKAIECYVNIAPLREVDRTISGVILSMDDRTA